LQRNIVFEEVLIKNLTLDVKNEKRPLPSIATTQTFKTFDKISKAKEFSLGIALLNGLYIKRISIDNAEFIFEDYSMAQPLNTIKMIDINGTIENLFVSLRKNGILKGVVRLNGQFNSTQDGFLKIDGSFAKIGDEIDFDLELNINDANLIRFSSYYSKTSFVVLKQAKVNLYSRALCRKNELDAAQDVRIYDIKLNEDIMPTDEDVLFGLPAKTVINFFNNSERKVEFSFRVDGTINDPRFNCGPIIEQVLSDALGDKIMAELRKLPREVIKISEKTIREGIEGGDFEDFEELKKNITKVKKKLKKIINYE